MAERTHIPSSPACGLWEILLADALDGQLMPSDEAVFTAHMAVCPACAALFDEARKGREWLEFLSPEPEVPFGLLDKILAHTGPGQVAGYGVVAGDVAAMPQPFIPAWQRPGFLGALLRFAEPRLMMTAAMAFFSIALTLNLAGIHLTALRLADLRPSAVRAYPTIVRFYMERQLTMASVPIVRYYDHLHVFYELQSRMRELRGVTEGEGEEYQQRYQTQPVAPGQSRQNPGGSVDRPFPATSPVNPALVPGSGPSTDILEASLKVQYRSTTPATETHRWEPRSAPSLGSATALSERNTLWTA